MPRVTILQRSETVAFPEPGQAVDIVEVTFVSDAAGVRSVTLPVELYRPATPEELAAHPRYERVPVDAPSEAAEKKAIQADLEGYGRQTPAGFDLP